MTVTTQEIDAMARYRAILAGETVEDETPKEAQVRSINESVDATSDMKDILTRFYSGNKESLQSFNKEVEENITLKEALTTRRTPNGVQVGSWEITVNTEGTGKTYDVSNVHTNESIACDLVLYESAISITKLLNMRVGINSKQIRKILDLEEQYSHIRQEAAVFKYRAKQRAESGDDFRSAIANDRFLESKAQALALREEIVHFSKSI